MLGESKIISLETLRIKGCSRHFTAGFSFEKFAQAFHHGRDVSVGVQSKVVKLHRISGVVIELHASLAVGPIGIAPTLGADAAAHHGFR